MPNRSINLFANNRDRASLLGDSEVDGPQVPLVCLGESIPSGAEWLTGAGDSVKRLSCLNTGEREGERPAANASEEVALIEPVEVSRSDILNAP